MPKLLLKFTNKLLRALDIEQLQTLIIGRGADCDISIDSIRCGPRHARLTRQGEHDYRIEPLDSLKYPLIINDQEVNQHLLRHGDALHFGDYTLEFQSNSQVYRDPRAGDDDADQRLWKVKIAEAMPGFMQIMNGPKMGRIIKLTREATPLGGKGKECAIIHQHQNRYFISALECESGRALLNGEQLKGEKLALASGDLVQIDGMKMEFQQE